MHDIINAKSLAILHVSLRWESDIASHVKIFYVPLNVWRERELLPKALAQVLPGQRAGFVLKASFSPGSLVPPHNEARVRWFPPESFAQGRQAPRLGRFYPRGLLPGYAQTSSLSGARQSAMAGFLPILTTLWLNSLGNGKSLRPRCKKSGLIPAGFAMTGSRSWARVPACKSGRLERPRISWPAASVDINGFHPYLLSKYWLDATVIS